VDNGIIPLLNAQTVAQWLQKLWRRLDFEENKEKGGKGIKPKEK